MRVSSLLLTRRQFLKLAFVAGTMWATGCVGEGNGATDQATPIATPPAGDDPITETYETAQPTPNQPPDPGVLRFFDDHEAATVAAFTTVRPVGASTS